MGRLNPQQQEAVRHTETPLLVLAGAGSGKTRVITQKISELVSRHGHRPEHIAAVTFTNKAALEMRARVSGRLSRRDVAKLTICTFHRLGLGILRRESVHLGFGNRISILDPEDSLGLLRELITEQDQKLADWAVRLQWQVSTWKNDLTEPADALAQAETPGEARMAEWYKLYERHLQARNAVDLDDLILRSVRLFRDNDAILDRWRGRIRYLLVDEYQDTNAAQYELVRLLTGARGRLTVVGDDDQSIYAWRGANPENLGRLADDFPTLRVIKLEQNYRSGARILRAANEVIGNNPHTFEKRLWSEIPDGSAIRIIPCDNEEGEAERVVTELLAARAREGGKFSDFAILYRGNHQSRPLELALRRLRIPYRVSGGTSFFNRTEVRDIVAYLRLLANPDDDLAFLRVINTPKREIGPGTVEKLSDYARQRNRPLYTACNELGLDSHLNEKAAERLRKFTAWMDRLRELAASEPDKAVRELVADIDYESWLFQQHGARAAESRMENVRSLVDMVESFFTRIEDAGFEEMVTNLMLRDILDRDDPSDTADEVHLMTLHAAKGLEFPHVYIIGMEENLLPHRSCIEAEDVTEERRLMYVGITRAQRALTLTYAGMRRVQGKPVGTEPSRFLEELPDAEIEWVNREAQGESLQQRRQKGKSRISELRGMLNQG